MPDWERAHGRVWAHDFLLGVPLFWARLTDLLTTISPLTTRIELTREVLHRGTVIQEVDIARPLARSALCQNKPYSPAR